MMSRLFGRICRASTPCSRVVRKGREDLPERVGREPACTMHGHFRKSSPHIMDSPAQPRNPLHGITLARMVEDLADYYGWEELGRRIPVRCFTHDPSVSSSLKFLRKTPWAREKVEGLYLYTLRQTRQAD